MLLSPLISINHKIIWWPTKMRDLHDTIPDISLKVSRVGIESLKISIKTLRKDGINILFPEVSIYVDLPSTMKGVHISRSAESVREVVDKVKQMPIRFLEDFCAKIAKRVLNKHEYASKAEVRMKSDYSIIRKTPASSSISDEYCKIYAAAIGRRTKNRVRIRRFIGVEIIGMTVCPCLKELISEHAQEELAKKMEFSKKTSLEVVSLIPMLTHTQRCLVNINIETFRKHRVDLENLIQIAEESVSAPTFSILKRPDEVKLILDAYTNSRLLEDVVREILRKIIETHPKLPNKTLVGVRCVNEESLHKYNLVAERIATIGKLRSELNSTHSFSSSPVMI